MHYWVVHLASALTKLKWGLMPVGVGIVSVMVILWLARGRPGRTVQRATGND